MLELALFSSRRLSVAIGAMGLVIFALMGAFFLLTQYLQFSLGYSALATGLRMAPIAAVLLVVAPASTLAVRYLGTKPIVFSGLALVAVGLALMSLPALFLVGTGVGLVLAPCTESVMGSLPLAEVGVGSATNSTALQLGGALGVGVLGSLLNTRYADRLAPVLAGFPVKQSILHLITGSLGGALAVAQRAGGRDGALLAAVAKSAFVSGMDLALLVGAVVVAVAAFGVLAMLPTRGASPAKQASSARPGSPRRS
jgi:hypothetical protein